MSDRLRVLMVEDDEADAQLTCYALARGGFEPDWLRVDSADALTHALEEREWDVVISDYAMPSFDGLRAFSIFLDRKLDIPFIFVSGALGEERAVEAMRLGAHDYMLKGSLGRLSVAIRREMRAASHRRQQKSAEESARRQQRRLQLAVDVSGAGVFESLLPPSDDTFVADRCLEILGVQRHDLPAADMLFDWVRERVDPDDRPQFEALCLAFVVGEIDELSVELRMRHRQGHWLDLQLRARAFAYDEAGRVSHLVGVVLDLTDRKRMEGRLRQKHKMEAIGRLAGGIAHDFNNVLTAISSFGTFALESLDGDHPARADIAEVLGAGSRAAALTSQLLAFTRLKQRAPKDIVAGDVVKELQRMLRRLLGEDIDIAVQLGPTTYVRIDPTELEQVLINLTVNARDAMPKGGKLLISLENATVDGPVAGLVNPEAPDGEYLRISVSDTGIGMDEATQARIFDPFFTTKEAGRGTGLGLATCYGIVQQAGGFIALKSEPGHGSTFEVYLPVASGAAMGEVVSTRAVDLDGDETVLLAEDDDSVRALVARTLRRRGYRVLESKSGAEALAKAATESGPIALLLSDVVMPGLSGGELAAEMRKVRPDIRVLFMSGYQSATQRSELGPDAVVVQKPFTPDALAHEVRAVLGPRAAARV